MNCILPRTVKTIISGQVIWWKRTAIDYYEMDSYRTYWSSNMCSGLRSEKSQEENTLEVESRVPLPYPFPFSDQLDDNNSVVLNTSLLYVKHKKNGHRLRIVSKISLPTPPYSVSMIK